jgi:precorrin-6A/cobalt-precorrin-6A reductase
MNRIHIRVLPVKRSLDMLKEAGVPMNQVITEHPPFHEEDNVNHIKQWNIKYMVTKDSGREGNTLEKLRASKQMGIPLLVIDRPNIPYEIKTNSFADLVELLNS